MPRQAYALYLQMPRGLAKARYEQEAWRWSQVRIRVCVVCCVDVSLRPVVLSCPAPIYRAFRRVPIETLRDLAPYLVLTASSVSCTALDRA